MVGTHALCYRRADMQKQATVGWMGADRGLVEDEVCLIHSYGQQATNPVFYIQ